MVDALVLTVSSKPEAARHCLDTIRHCKEALGLPTTMGLSNVSFRPARARAFELHLPGHVPWVPGCSSCIANPASTRLREVAGLGRGAPRARPPGRVLHRLLRQLDAGQRAAAPERPLAAHPAQARPPRPREAVILGDKAGLLSMIEAALAEGAGPLRPGGRASLSRASWRLARSTSARNTSCRSCCARAEAMQAGFARLEPLLLASGRAEKKTPIVMATVEGDIHDIGKNIVCLMLKNHGFEVFDLGKDVPASADRGRGREGRGQGHRPVRPHDHHHGAHGGHGEAHCASAAWT